MNKPEPPNPFNVLCENSAEVIYLLDQLSAALDTMLTHFANQTPPADMASRATLLNQADKLLRQMGER